MCDVSKIASIVAAVVFACTADACVAQSPGAKSVASGAETRTLGTTVGSPFRERPPAGAKLVGVKIAEGRGAKTIQTVGIEPIFRSGAANLSGLVFGVGGSFSHAEARPGYAVGAIVGQSGDRLSGIRLIFMREKEVGLDPSDSYQSRWLGPRIAGPEIRIDGGGRPIVSISGHIDRYLTGLGFTFEGDAGSGLDLAVRAPAGPQDVAQAKSQLEKMGVRLTADETRPGAPIIKADFSGMQLNRGDTELLQAFSELEIVDLSYTFSPTGDIGLGGLAGLKNLRELDLTDAAPLDRYGFLALRELTTLRKLTLPKNYGIDDTSLAMLRGLSELEALTTGGSGITDQGIAHLTSLKQLHALWLDNTRLTDEGAKSLSQISTLKHICLRGSKMTDVGLASLATMSQLESLEILHWPFPKEYYEPRMTGIGLRELLKLEQLKKLAVSGVEVQIDDKAIGFVVSMKNLEELVIYGTKITDAGVRVVGTLRKLHTLSLEHSPNMTDAGMAHLVRMSTLKHLWLSQTPIGGEGLAHLARLEGLEKLYLNDTKVDDDGLAHLAELRQLETLALNRAQVQGAGLKHLKSLTKLEQLELDGNPLSAPPWEDLKDLTELRAMTLRSTKINDSDLDGLKNLTGLRRLFLGGTPIGDRGAAALASFGKFEALELVLTQVGDEGVRSLTGMISLKELDISGTRVTDAGLQDLAKLNLLHTLTLIRTQVSDSGIRSLGDCKRLIRVFLTQTRVTKTGAKQLQTSLPYVAVFLERRIPEKRVP